MVFSIKYKVHQKLVGVMVIENISKKLHSIVQSSGARKFDLVHSMALPYFILCYVRRFAEECFWRQKILGY